MFKHSIFLRIYAGLLALVLIIAVLAYLLVQVINYQRAQEYRESLTDGISYVISQGVARQKTEQQRQNWIHDSAKYISLPMQYISAEQADLSRDERRRIEDQKAAVRYDAEAGSADVLVGVANDPNRLLAIKIDSLNERQLKSLPTFVLDYLVYYPGEEKQYLGQLQEHFSYPISIEKVNDLKLDSDQINRLRLYGSILVYRDSASIHGTTVSIIAAMPNSPSEVFVMGPVPLFNWMPFQLAAGVTLLSLFILSLGVYVLMMPMQRRLREVNRALNKMQAGNLSIRLPVDGTDEMAHLATSYNNMAEHIERLIGAQRELMRAVSHELRTPVARIRFALEMLVDEDDYDYRLQQMEQIDKDIEALNKLIDEIMTYAKLEQGMPAIEFEQVSLADVMQQVLEETKALKTGKELVLQAPDASVMVETERRYLHRVIQNLVGNAVRYSDHRVILSGGVRADGSAYICVEDDGNGIAEEDRKKVFEAFSRLDDSRTRASGGYGLGLSIVSRIAYWFGGSVQVDDSPQLGGARFTMVWPGRRSTTKKKARSLVAQESGF